MHLANLLSLRSCHGSPRNELGWQLYAGSRTGTIGTRQTRRSPTHSRHNTELRTQKKRLQLLWGRLCAYCLSDRDVRSLNLQRQQKVTPQVSKVQQRTLKAAQSAQPLGFLHCLRQCSPDTTQNLQSVGSIPGPILQLFVHPDRSPPIPGHAQA